ncbi:hypothetical protein MVEN_01150400 [Mycena venus]|uniref:F-box domain-containing protein n=1 Tax=Mycena venus TaxID=2733690 RepID=A0A8H6Y3B0_9AGAR|nr:hypothetical protein MVEN_01150400 [Mycena venus]
MHPALAISEILYLIFSHFSHRDDSCVLSILARICKTFRDPALDLLWANQDGLVNLLLCMPQDVFDTPELNGERIRAAKRGTFRSTEGFDVQMCLARPLVESDWHRVSCYAPRVKSLVFTDEARQMVSEILPSLITCVPRFLLPNLETLRWGHSRRDLHYIRLFLGPKLTTLHASFDPSITNLSLFSTLKHICPELMNISIHFWDESDAADHTFSAFITALSHVETLTTDCTITSKALVAHLPTFRSLSLANLPRIVTPLPTASQLRSVTLGPLYPYLANAFLNSSRFPEMEDICVTFNNNTLAKTISDFFLALAASCSPTSLALIRVDQGPNDFYDSGPNEMDPYVISANSLQILSHFRNLESFRLTTPTGLDADDDSVGDLARSWPHLRDLSLKAVYPPTHQRTTLRCLDTLASHCPDLSQLTISLDARQIPSITGVRQTSLERLEVRYSQISSAQPVAAYLSALFPRLKMVQVSMEALDYYPDEEPIEYAWDCVSRYLSGLSPQHEVGSGGVDEQASMGEEWAV